MTEPTDADMERWEQRREEEEAARERAAFDAIVEDAQLLLSMESECESLRAQLAERDSDREYLAAAMIRCSFATADGDTLRALVDEMEPQIVDLYAQLAEAQREMRYICSFCDTEFKSDNPDESMKAHIAACEQHPLRAALTERDKLREFVAAFDAWRLRVKPEDLWLSLPEFDAMLEKRAAAGG